MRGARAVGREAWVRTVLAFIEGQLVEQLSELYSSLINSDGMRRRPAQRRAMRLQRFLPVAAGPSACAQASTE